MPTRTYDAIVVGARCAGAPTAMLLARNGYRSFEAAMAGYQSTRDERVLPFYEYTTQLATLQPPPPDLRHLLGAVHGNRAAMDGFARVNAGVTSPAEFFAEDNVGRILAAADGRPVR